MGSGVGSGAGSGVGSDVGSGVGSDVGSDVGSGAGSGAGSGVGVNGVESDAGSESEWIREKKAVATGANAATAPRALPSGPADTRGCAGR